MNTSYTVPNKTSNTNTDIIPLLDKIIKILKKKIKKKSYIVNIAFESSGSDSTHVTYEGSMKLIFIGSKSVIFFGKIEIA